MACGEHDITVDQGSLFYQDFKFLQLDGNPVNLTGSEFAAQIKEKRDLDADPVATMEVTIMEPTEGTIRVTLSPAESRKVKTTGFWDLIRAPSGTREMLLRGKAVLNQGVTNV